MHLNKKQVLAGIILGVMTWIQVQPAAAEEAANEVSGDSWAIYWYLCGSDLESENGAATDDLNEMLEVELPENVKVVIETGGAAEWQNDLIDSSCLERYVYGSDGMEFIEQQPSASMGDAQTLTEFLSFCKENYPAEHTAVVFWNHGGGSAQGVAFDELYDYDSLTLDEMYQAFGAVSELSVDAPPYDLVGFDACLMATIDTAYAFNDIARYLVASEETEPGNGWNYSGLLSALAENTGMDGAELGSQICDTYMTGCEAVGTEDEATLSVIDLGQITPLLTAYDDFGKGALAATCADPVFYSEFGRGAEKAENYGGNTEDQGYTNLVDLKDLAEQNSSLLEEQSQNVLDCLEECVVYQVKGSYRQHAGGLSCYYSYNGDTDDFNQYASVSASESFTYLYEYVLNGELDETGLEYVNSLGYEDVSDLAEIPALSTEEELTYPIYIDDDGYAVMELDEETRNKLKGVYFQLSYMDEAEDIMLYLGRDNDIDMDWDNGVFMDNFRGVWGAIDGYLCYVDIVYEGEDYNLYNVPILLNGEEYQLRVVYDYYEEEYQILGARKGLDDNGMADRNLVQLLPGDEITTLHYGASISGDDELTMIPVDTFEVTEDTSFEEIELGDGTFVMSFELVDSRNNSLNSEPILFTVTDGVIDAEV